MCVITDTHIRHSYFSEIAHGASFILLNVIFCGFLPVKYRVVVHYIRLKLCWIGLYSGFFNSKCNSQGSSNYCVCLASRYRYLT